MIRTTVRLTGLAGALVASTLLLAGCGDDASGAAGHGSR
jgi:outer membrane murein-binding lipoprotein Lpp